MDVLLWVLIGLAAGATAAALLPEMGPRSVSGSAWRRVRAMAAGAVGAIAAGYGIILFEPSLVADGLTTALASLAGALLLAGIVEVYRSRRRRGEDSVASAADVKSSRAAIDTPAYDAARQALVGYLIEDAVAHETGHYAEIGRQLPAIRATVAREDPAWNPRLRLALRFWLGWTEARDHQWAVRDEEKSLAKGDWPRLARAIASDLALDRDTMDPAILTRFAYATASTTGHRAPLAGTRLFNSVERS
jgi:uncharacterized membrane protein YeaQ/YmgE (transglycosylase-associated protein family)